MVAKVSPNGCASRHKVRLLIFSLFIFSSAMAQRRAATINIPYGRITLQEVIDSIESGGRLLMHWPNGALNPRKIVQGTGGPMPLRAALKLYFEGDSFWEPRDGTIVVAPKGPEVQSANGTGAIPFMSITVMVQDPLGAAIPSANLRIARTGQVIRTDTLGKASIFSVFPGDTIYCTHAGKGMEWIVVGRNKINHITLTDQPSTNDPAFVTQYVDASKKRYTGNIIEVKKEEITDQPVSNLQAALAGRVPGLMVTQSSGGYGANIDVILRGKLSILNGHLPLYIINGVPFAPGPNSVSNIMTGTAAGLNPFSFFDKDVVDKIQVLKDADATAIYGSRGANGVIIITTQRHTSDNGGFSAGAQEGVSLVTRVPRMMNIQEYVKMRREALQNDGLTPNATNAPELLKWDTTRNVDWQKMFVRGWGRTTKAHASYSAGGLRNDGFIGVNWLRESNVFISHPAHELFSLNGNVSHKSANGRLNGNMTLLAGWDNNAQFATDVSRLQFLAPNAPPLLDGNGRPIFNYNGVAFSNPLSLIGNKYKAKSHNYLASTDIKYRLWKSLWIKVTSGLNDVQSQEFSSRPGWNQDTTYTPVRSSFLAHDRFHSWIIEPSLEYKLRLKDWKLSALAGASWQGQSSIIDMVSAYGFSSDELLGSPANGDSVVYDTYKTHYLYTAWFGQLTLDWKGTRVLNFSGRRDRSSQFMGNNRYGNFGAVGFGWTFSEEPFFRNILPAVSFGKLRISHGITGNDGIGGGVGYLEDWDPTAILNFQTGQNIGRSFQVTSDVSFEHVRKTEISLDWGFLKEERIRLTATWYLDRASHQLLPDSLQTFDNVVRLHNRPVVVENIGWEFSLTSVNIRNNGLTWTTNVNISLPVNKLAAFRGIANTPFASLVVGQSLSALKAYEFKGVDPQKGTFMFADRNKDGSVNKDDQSLVIRPGIRCFGGMENIFSFRHWQIRALLEFRFQTGVSYQAAIYTANRPGSIVSGLYSNETSDMLNRWRKDGDVAPYQMLTTKGLSQAGRVIGMYLSSSGIVTNADFLRLKTLSVSRTVPQLFGKVDGKIFLQTENLLTMTHYKGADPENQSILALPPLRTVTVGVDLTL